MNQTLLSSFGTAFERVEHALDALREGRGVMVLDDEDRENEGDMIFAAETMTVEQMALTIRHGSGIVCLCLTEERRKQLDLPMMVENNTSAYGTGFTRDHRSGRRCDHRRLRCRPRDHRPARPSPTARNLPISTVQVTSSRCVRSRAAY
ncbi:3,4-dihydroxy-2-butanone 4-phosphate synthase [Klebsiella pneumoniae]|nr:3,4-dihydroxy-2-butanone 4-phosphate synthase [Klebsiella pneumoniae]